MKFMDFIKKNTREILAAFVLASTLFFVAPISVYISNARSLDFKLGDIWYFYLIITLVVFLVVTAATLLIKPVIPFAAVILMAVSVGFIIQGNFLITNIGVLDGHTILWDTFRTKSWLELVLWGLIIGLSLVFHRFFYKNLSGILLILVIYQVGVGLINFISNPVQEKGKSSYFETANEFEFSNKQNVILVVLDTFRSEAFTAILQRYPEYREVFKDFTFYKDAVGGYPTTLPSIPLLLTGEYYDNSIPISDFIAKNQDNAISTVLKKNGFIVETYPLVPYYRSVYDNRTTNMPLTYKQSLVVKQYIVSGIRFVPLAIKKYFVKLYYQGQNYYHKDMADFASRVGQTKVTDQQKTFKFIHLSGAHLPAQLDNSLSRVDKGYIEQAAASIKLMKEMISELKDAGGYDNSLIIIVGDHGSEAPWEYSGPSPAYSTQPLMLAKRVDQHFDEMQNSDSPVSNSDIPKTISDELKIENSYPGYSIFQPIPADRVRKFFYYHWKHSNWSTDYFPLLYEYEILGPAYQQESYTLLRQYIKNKVANISPLYRYGDNIIETILANDLYQWSLDNISYEENEGQFWAWGSGPKACIHLPVEAAKKEMTLSMLAKPFLVKGQLDDQIMNVSVDKIPLSSFSKNDKMEAVIPSDLAEKITHDKKIELCFDFPNATKSPKDYGVSEGNRRLGYQFTSIILK